ncbi:MAG: hypothetical protein Q8P25_04735 [Candidatus Curtissbacteria bacterium]|nr:hypothetical protein [Candidatus Curtissbacteria bacterium]
MLETQPRRISRRTVISTAAYGSIALGTIALADSFRVVIDANDKARREVSKTLKPVSDLESLRAIKVLDLDNQVKTLAKEAGINEVPSVVSVEQQRDARAVLAKEAQFKEAIKAIPEREDAFKRGSWEAGAGLVAVLSGFFIKGIDSTFHRVSRRSRSATSKV